MRGEVEEEKGRRRRRREERVKKKNMMDGKWKSRRYVKSDPCVKNGYFF